MFDQTESTLLLMLMFLTLMGLWALAEYLFLELPRRWRVRQWQKRLRVAEMRVDRWKGATRSTVRPL